MTRLTSHERLPLLRAKWWFLGCLLLTTAGCQPPLDDSAAEQPSAVVTAAPLDSGWVTGGGDHAQRYFSALDQINTENVTRLGFAWEVEVDTTHGFEATPVLFNGVLYSSGPRGAVYAVDARSGALRWQFEPEIDTATLRKVCCGIINRGVAVADGRVFVGAVDGVLHALDAASGDSLWQVDTITDRMRGYTITGAPYIAGGVVVIGNSGAELDARGYVTAYHVDTGELAWRFFTVPASKEGPHEHPELVAAAETWDVNSLWQVGLGGTVWDGMAWDPELNLLYVGTGNAAPYPRKLRSPGGGDNLYLASILAISPDDGRLVWYYQTVPAENWDYTATQKMILADLEINGATRKVLMQAPKNGFFYVLDRITGELISAEPYVPVNWASHVDLETGRPIETGQGEYFDAPRYVTPSPAGGHNWQPMAFNPSTGLVYIPTVHAGAVWAMPETPFEYVPGGFNMASVYIFPVPGPWGIDGEAAAMVPNLQEILAEAGDTTVRGFLKAWDPVRQTVVWQVETSGQWVGEMFASWNGGGLMTTAGGLVFQGRGTGDFVALDAQTGVELHRLNTGVSIMAAPMTYMLDGEQYIAVMAGLGGAVGQVHLPGTAAHSFGNTGRIIAFKLGGKPMPVREPLLRVDVDVTPPPVTRQGTDAMREQGARLFVAHCVKCHSNAADGADGIPDLRRMTAATHASFSEILLSGALAEKGMGSFADILSTDEVSALHSYLIDQAWQWYESETGSSAPHRPPGSGEEQR